MILKSAKILLEEEKQGEEKGNSPSVKLLTHCIVEV